MLYFQFFTLVSFKFLRNILYSYITIIEILITFNRYFIIKSTNKIKTKRNDKLLVYGLGVVCFIIYAPYLFTYKIDWLKGTLSFTEFSETQFYIIYFQAITIGQNLLTIIILIPYNIIVLIAYKKFIVKKQSILRSVIIPTRIENQITMPLKANSQKRFTKMILIISFLFIFIRLSSILVQMFAYYSIFNPTEAFDLYVGILNTFSTLSIYFSFSINIFIYYVFNLPFKETFISIFSFQKFTNKFT